MKELLSRLWKDESGQGLVEYVLIIALVAIGLIVIMVIFRNSIGDIFSRIKSTLDSSPTSTY
jgi:pilus assembly protein Flp/PilA